ncbi:hypothetical protein PR048_017782 [Dryococelus australis]|uniref:Uncharacterized protein n=1 Tax=Dryococelus australis TaxID=614101 RepID=A0ABQ9HAR7_9NEOP|nr:hypothetical protein PR048_017782 [Dryococelus australis]
MWESCRTMPLVGWFSRCSPVSSALPFHPRSSLGQQRLATAGDETIPEISACGRLVYHGVSLASNLHATLFTKQLRSCPDARLPADAALASALCVPASFTTTSKRCSKFHISHWRKYSVNNGYAIYFAVRGADSKIIFGGLTSECREERKPYFPPIGVFLAPPSIPSRQPSSPEPLHWPGSCRILQPATTRRRGERGNDVTCGVTLRRGPCPLQVTGINELARGRDVTSENNTGDQRRNEKGEGEREIPEKTRRPAVSSGTIPTCRNLGVTWPGIEPVSL